jgi:hypothetical protein
MKRTAVIRTAWEESEPVRVYLVESGETWSIPGSEGALKEAKDRLYALGLRCQYECTQSAGHVEFWISN